MLPTKLTAIAIVTMIVKIKAIAMTIFLKINAFIIIEISFTESKYVVT